MIWTAHRGIAAAAATAAIPRRYRRWRGLAAGIAVFSLLLRVFLPTGFSLAVPATSTMAGFCGSAPPPGQKQLPSAAGHCLYCLLAAAGPAPAAARAAPMPAVAGNAGMAVPRAGVVAKTVLFAAAQPRGPPLAL